MRSKKGKLHLSVLFRMTMYRYDVVDFKAGLNFF